MNEFYKDAAYFSSRCVPLLDPKMPMDNTIDSVLHFAFCAERLFKGVLWDIDQRLVLENSKDENCFAVLHRDKLIPTVEANLGDKVNRNTITFKEAMLKAKNFSQVTHDHLGVLTKLSDYRGILAHRFLSYLDPAEARRFTLKHFYPIVSGFITEHKLTETDFLPDRAAELKKFADDIAKEDRFSEKMEALLEQHLQEWEKRKDDAEFVDKARRLTEITLDDEQQGDHFHHVTTCPACEEDAAVRFEVDWDVEGSGGDAWITGVYAAGMYCEFCDLELNDYEQIDYFKLNEMLKD